MYSLHNIAMLISSYNSSATC